ncbi:prepilin-type N-terminal cleavage/methylation domain protein [Lyngbya aestuarii BL J]|uniref:Prepilin-type N-terminal cleavage/methylation domain protein n=1 Tax=Lyngbya aestuarii BL J TaxID=1348334 RepID=U7QP65_9CYAN|nr:type II secretion system protein [Lyngbya aestuarii]ERT09062.1 prepilin-type N-terminal cleavage/methylation domain protein [Lyngbya aestuarii BL J]
MNIYSQTPNQLKRYLLQHSRKNHQTDGGFSLIEVMVVVVMVGILSAIAAPAWNGFVSRQRIRAVNGQVLQVLQTAQSEAKRNKVNRAIQFLNNGNMPMYKIYEADDNGNFDPVDDLISETVIKIDGQIQPGQIKITTQANNGTARLQDAIIFDYLGAVIDPEEIPDNGQNTDGFTVTVSTPDGGLKRCVKVVTLLGAMITSEGDDNTMGCP